MEFFKNSAAICFSVKIRNTQSWTNTTRLNQRFNGGRNYIRSLQELSFFSVKILTGEIDDMQGNSLPINYGRNFIHKAAGYTYYSGLKIRSDEFLIKTSQLLKSYNKFCISWQHSFIDKKCVTSLDFLSVHAKQYVHCIR